MLKRLVEWLDRKFPDQVVFTPKYEEMLKGCYGAIILLEDRVKKLEGEVTKINANLGFGAKGTIGLAPFLQR